MMNNILLYWFEMKKSHKMDDCSIIISIFLAIALLLLWNIKFLVYHIFFDNILVVDLVTIVVDMFVAVLAALVDTLLDGIIVIIDTSVA